MGDSDGDGDGDADGRSSSLSAKVAEAVFPFDPSHWSGNVTVRDSFDACWASASARPAKLACIAPELAHQAARSRALLASLEARLSERERELLVDDLTRLPSATDGSCRAPYASGADEVDIKLCELYRTALRATYLDTQVALEGDTKD